MPLTTGATQIAAASPGSLERHRLHVAAAQREAPERDARSASTLGAGAGEGERGAQVLALAGAADQAARLAVGVAEMPVVEGEGGEAGGGEALGDGARSPGRGRRRARSP